MKKLENIEFCLTNTTKQLNSTERKELLMQHDETPFVTISIPVITTFSKRGTNSVINSISEVTGVIPYYFLFTTGESYCILNTQ